MLVSKLIINAAVKLLKRQFKLDKILKYVEQPNELDNKSEELENRIKLLEAFAHPSQEYICCRKCGCEITKTKEN